MKRFNALILSTVLCAATGPSLMAGPTITFDFAYAGSTNTTLTSSQVISGLGIVPNSNLTQVDYHDPAYQNTTWRHYFDLTVQFNADAPGEALRAFIGSIKLSGAIKAITPAATSGGTTQKYFAFNPNVDGAVGSAPFYTTTAFFSVGDAGTAGDLQSILATNNDAAIALTTQVGVGGGGPVTGEGVTSLPFTSPTAVGRFAIAFDAPLTQTASILATAGTGYWFSYFTNQTGGPNSNSYSTVNIPYAPNGIDIDPAYTVNFRALSIAAAPEPASLAMLVCGATALWARRRR